MKRQGHSLISNTLRLGCWAVLLAVAIWLRAVTLDLRPMHTDEAVQGMIFAELLESGTYAYNPHHFHGPSLYYLTLPSAGLRGQFEAASLDSLTLRLVPCFFGLLLAAAPFLFRKSLGPRGTLVAAGFLLLSPGMVYYGGYYVQEMVLVSGLAWFLGCAWQYLHQRRWQWAAGAGLAGGLMLASKETALAYLAVASIGLWIFGPKESAQPGRRMPHLLVAVAAALLVLVPLYSSFGSHPEGLADAVRALFIYEAGSGHEKPWHYYLGMLLGTDRSILRLQGESCLFLASQLGAAFALIQRLRAPNLASGRLFLFMAAILLLIASILSYKTPWLLLVVLFPMAMLAGWGAEAVWARLSRPVFRVGLVAILVFAWGDMIREAIWTNRTRPADSRNFYAYVHTSWDVSELSQRIHQLTGGQDPPVVKVIADEYWPLPWYFRDIEQVGYWTELPGDPYAPVMIVGAELSGELDPARLEGYVTEFRGLRPGKLLLVYIRRDLWESRVINANQP